jgi:hypothetical protein
MNDGFQIKNTFDRRSVMFNVIMLIISFAIMAILVIVAKNKIAMGVIAGMLGLFAFYILIITQIRATPVDVVAGGEGLDLRFMFGGHSFVRWDEISGWKKLRYAGKDSCVGIWAKGRKMYWFDEGAASAILKHYYEIKGVPMNELSPRKRNDTSFR